VSACVTHLFFPRSQKHTETRWGGGGQMHSSGLSVSAMQRNGKPAAQHECVVLHAMAMAH
jgi:hypothetical protein